MIEFRSPVTARRRALGALALLGGVMLPAATAHAVTDTITSQPGYSYSGATGPGGAFSVDAGSQPLLVNADPGSDGAHNLVASADGPDGNELFETPLLSVNETAPVNGAQYLEPGSYPFVCTIHFGMGGTLAVSGPGALPRPAIDVSIATSKLRKVQKGKLKLKVEAATASPDVSVFAKFQGSLGIASDIDLAAGESRVVTLRLTKAAKKRFKGLKRAKISVIGSVPYGSPASSSRSLK